VTQQEQGGTLGWSIAGCKKFSKAPLHVAVITVVRHQDNIT